MEGDNANHHVYLSDTNTHYTWSEENEDVMGIQACLVYLSTGTSRELSQMQAEY